MEGLGERTLNRSWQLIVTAAAPGAWNMALDEALAESVKEGGPPFLRFYSWAPNTLSLGRFQNPQTGLSDQARAVPRVRRLTGGGAIWHADEITYSLACRQEDLGITGVKPSFEKLCGFLLDTWKALGWDACFAKDHAPDQVLGAFTPACFAGQEEYDILVDGKKLGGNAQKRDRDFLFQHGSIPLSLDHQTLEDLFLPGYRPFVETTTDLRAAGWKGSGPDLIPRLVAAFANHIGVAMEAADPTAAQTLRAETLVHERYGQNAWTETGGGSLRNP